jgi:hypothetical protein
MVPHLDTARVRAELVWQPAYDAPTTVRELLEGMHERNGIPAALSPVGVS